MRYSYELSRHLERDLEKIQKKDKERFEILLSKMSEILDNPHYFKPLRHDLKGLRRVHLISHLFSFLRLLNRKIRLFSGILHIMTMFIEHIDFKKLAFYLLTYFLKGNRITKYIF